MKVIVLASQKGGSGKTTLCGHLAVEAERIGAGPVALIDTDPQGSLSDWWNSRTASTLQLARTDSHALDDVLARLKSDGTQLVLIDTAPAKTPAVAHVISRADLVLIPVRPSPHDLRAVAATVEMAEQLEKPLVFVINAATARARITGETAVALSQHGTVSPVTIHQRVEFAASMVDGRSVGEITQTSPSAKEIRELWLYVRQRLARLAGERGTVLHLLQANAFESERDDDSDAGGTLDDDERAVVLDEVAADEEIVQELVHVAGPSEVPPIVTAPTNGAIMVEATAEDVFHLVAEPPAQAEPSEFAVASSPDTQTLELFPASQTLPAASIFPHSVPELSFTVQSPSEVTAPPHTTPEPTGESDPLAMMMSAVPEPLVPTRPVYVEASLPPLPAPVSDAVPEIVALSTWEPKSLPPIRKTIDAPAEAAARNATSTHDKIGHTNGDRRKRNSGILFGSGDRSLNPFGRRSSDRLLPFGKVGVNVEPT